MNFIKNIFKRNYKHHEGVYNINIYLLRLVYFLTAFAVGSEVWTHIFTYAGPWDHVKAVAFCAWAAYSALSILGLVNPLRMLPIIMFIIFYKTIWLILIAYPLWSSDKLAGSPAEQMTYTFLWIPLAIVAMPWRYFFTHFVLKSRIMSAK